jgi:hypothetical protein
MQENRLKPYDQIGRRLSKGDWVRLVAIPPEINKMPKETKDIFKKALGKTFKIESFDKYGHAELDLTKKVEKFNFIWVEPEYLLRSRRKTTR